MPCSLKIAGKEHRALVLNLSKGGMFVRTTARIPPGTRVQLDLVLDEASSPVALSANVVWRRLAASMVSQMNEGGVGLCLAEPPASYESFVRELAGDDAVGERAAPEATRCAVTSVTRFDVRLKQNSGPRSRWLQVDGSDEDAARINAISSAGQDWEILEVRRAS